jgi:hypothetical protein
MSSPVIGSVLGSDSSSSPPSRVNPARLALGMAVLTAERLGNVLPANDTFTTAVGLVQQAAEETARAARNVAEPTGRAARLAAGWVGRLPGAELVRGPVEQAKERLIQISTEAGVRGRATVAAGRAEALAFVQSGVTDGMNWAQSHAVPQIVDELVPHLVEEVMPRLIDGAMPEIRARVLPAVIDDLTTNEQVRDLVREQGRLALSHTTDQLRASTATADDRVEQAFNRIFHGGQHGDPAGPASTDRG